MSKYKVGDEFEMKDPTCNRNTRGRITRHFKLNNIEKYEVTLIEPSLWIRKPKLTRKFWDMTEDKLKEFIIEDLS